jgi:hypothetical protein
MKHRVAFGFGCCVFSIFVFQNCTSGFDPADGQGRVEANSVMLAQANCKFVGPDVLSGRLTNLLKITSGDVPVLDDSGNPTGTMRIASNLATLGKGDPVNGVPDDYTCTAPKFKAAVEIMVDACSIGLVNAGTQTFLFPNGPRNFVRIYYAFVGRPPTDQEAALLASATGSMSTLEAEAAACSIVSASLESLISI